MLVIIRWVFFDTLHQFLSTPSELIFPNGILKFGHTLVAIHWMCLECSTCNLHQFSIIVYVFFNLIPHNRVHDSCKLSIRVVHGPCFFQQMGREPLKNFIKNCAQQVNICLNSDIVHRLFSKFRRHINGRSGATSKIQRNTVSTSKVVCGHGKTPVEHHHFPVLTDQHVLRFQVPIDDATRMSKRNGVTDLEQNLQILFLGQLGHRGAPFRAGDMLHGIEQFSISSPAEVVYGNNIGMHQMCCHHGLRNEHRLIMVNTGSVGFQCLNRQFPIE